VGINHIVPQAKKFGGTFVRRAVSCRSILALSAALVLLPAAANASGLDLGTDADYAFIDLGTTTLGWNSGPLAGNVLFGQGLTVNTSGGNNGGLSNGGVIQYDNTVIANPSPPGSGLQNPPPTQLVSTSTTANALTTAQNVSNFASSLSATQTFGNISGPTTITGTSGTNVIDVANIQNAPLTINGPSNAQFVFNVSGQIQTNQTMTLTGGVTAGNVLFNLTGSSGSVLQTSGGDALVGTFLATRGGQFQFSELNLNGELINTDGNVQLVSGSKISPPATPIPGTLPLMATALVGGFAFLRKRRAQGRTAALAPA
jgi:hypothetical protein